MDHTILPLLEELNTYRNTDRAWLHVPGHGGGPGLPESVAGLLSGAAEVDLTELPGLDDLHNPESAIAEAQRLAADVWHTGESFFLVNGSTAGVLAMLLACCHPQDVVLAPRNAHGSFYHGLMLTGAVPHYLQVAEKEGIPLNVTVESVREGFARFPDARAVFLTSPGYHGVCADVEAIAKVAQNYGALVLLDEAHGAHLGFSSALPPGGGRFADMRVQSWHKTLGALTPGAVLHKNGERVDGERLRSALQWVQTSSPPYPLLLSLDAVRREMALRGNEITSKMAGHAGILRQVVARRLPLLQPEDVAAYGFTLDPTRVTMLTGKMGICGYDAARGLSAQGVDVELALPGSILAVVGPGYRDSYTATVSKAADDFKKQQSAQPAAALTLPEPRMLLSPREAYLAPSCLQPAYEAQGKTAAAMVISYPPGIPLLVPGEEITESVLDYLQWAQQAGVRFRGVYPGGCLRVLA